MKRSWEEIRRLASVNATHRTGWKLGDVPVLLSLKNAASELVELAAAPDDITEMADLFGCLIVYCVKMGWTVERVETALMEKLKRRFKEDN